MKTALDAAVGRLDDYVRGKDERANADQYERELFELALSGEAPELRFLDRLGNTFKHMDRRGTLDLWLRRSDVERLVASGLKVLFQEVEPGASAPSKLPDDVDLVVTRLHLPLAGVRRLEAEVFSPDGKLLKRMPDVGFDASDDAIYACCDARLARTASRVPSVTRVWATDRDGRRLLAEISIA